jgi:hypothetical protein
MRKLVATKAKVFMEAADINIRKEEDIDDESS